MLVVLLAALCSQAEAQPEAGTVAWGEALDQAPAWYAGDEAVRIADNVLLYQHANGGWWKNIDMAQPLSDADRDHLRAQQAEAGTTIDNGATHTQLRYLARAYEATGHDRFRAGFLRGLEYLLDAEYENGGWPQYYPIRRGYYEHITFNDGAMMGVMRLLRDVARGHAPYAFVEAPLRQRCEAAIERGLTVLLKTQVEVDGRLTVWCAQHDHENLSCAQARSYELPSLSGGESVGIVRYLMEIEAPSPAVIRAVEAAVAWFERVKLTDVRLLRREDPSLPKGYDLVVGFDPAGASPLWARFYEIGTNYPMFVGRDGAVHYALSEIEHERRVGYRWLGDWARELLEEDYPVWHSRYADR